MFRLKLALPLWLLIPLSYLPLGGSLAAQDVVIEDPLPLLQHERDRMARRPLVRLGTANRFLNNPDKATSPYNTTMMVYDPLHKLPEGEEVTVEMLRQEVVLEKRSAVARLWGSITNLFRRR
jgi:hypothetical protein